MAEQEVIKHTKQTLKVWKGKKPFLHKLGDFALEIFIIVFAISLSIWFHNWSEHRHEQEDVKRFLLGLRNDMHADISEMQDDKRSYANQRLIYQYINNTKLGEKLNLDSLGKYYGYIFNATILNPNNGRFEGFKSSGKIGLIEDDSLQNHILDLYQENIPALLSETNNYVARKNGLYEYLQLNLKRTSDSTSNIAEILNSDEGHNRCARLTVTAGIQARYDKAIQKMQLITAAIDRKYGVIKK